MKFKTTRSAIVNGTNPKELFKCGYCSMSNLLHYHEPIAYTCGIYGWNFDVYTVHGLTITTGYRNMCGFSIPHELLQTYEQKAKTIIYDWSIPYETKKESVETLLSEFCNKLIGE